MTDTHLVWAAAGWALWLPPLKPGLAERFAWRGSARGWWIGGAALAAASAYWLPTALVALLPALAWGLWLCRHLRGQTGDLLGAGIELCESAALVLMLVAATISWPGG